MIVLDTHALVWLAEGNSRLGNQSRLLMDEALKAEKLFVSVITFWEVAMLVGKRRLEMQMSVDAWRKSLIDNGLKEVDLTGDMAINSAQLDDFHGDPVDRMIVSTAISLTATLCTADEKILGWNQRLMRLDARQ
ncbi:MAG: type II toxin-antitoxin system VapC family toxin [Burkholderiales bacterium]|nr:type II toxin-antitoxin system VapC family toxin [Nitrosomonas sp.]MCP5274564.1 type II toxin-antitoxin system VapC family toxin [Burkholderiales bacterium]